MIMSNEEKKSNKFIVNFSSSFIDLSKKRNVYRCSVIRCLQYSINDKTNIHFKREGEREKIKKETKGD